MKSVLLSIKPKYCELIANGKKTVEVRKTKPKLDTPFKCYIYCTKDKNISFWTGKRYSYADDRSHNLFDVCGNGKVIGEFICDKVDNYDDNTIHCFSHENYIGWNDFDLDRCCIHPQDFEEYANGKWLYGWHISDLKIYDTPKELSEFYTECKMKCEHCKMWRYTRVNADEFDMDCKSDWINHKSISRPPQSWCYVEEVTE